MEKFSKMLREITPGQEVRVVMEGASVGSKRVLISRLNTSGKYNFVTSYDAQNQVLTIRNEIR